MEPKTVRESQIELSQSMGIQDANLLGFVHGGVIMRMVDTAAGLVAIKHCGGGVVTAAIDEMTFIESVNLGDLVTVKASLNLVGRERRDAGEIGPAELEAAVAGLEARVQALLARRGHTEENCRLLKHLRNEAPALFTFLRHEGVDATNYRAEQGIRPAVVNRKVWGGSRTHEGGRTHERLVSLLRTAAQQGADAMAIFGELLRSPVPIVAPLAIL
ncbi:MAG: hotdog domain-containing protein, partial [Actinomycetota bacterium]